MIEYQDQHKRLSKSSRCDRRLIKTQIYLRLSVGLGSTKPRMSAIQPDRKRQLRGDSACMKTQIIIISEFFPQKSCQNIFIFIPLCKTKLLLSAAETEYLFLLILACQLHSLHATIVIRSPFIRVTPGEDKPCTSLT